MARASLHAAAWTSGPHYVGIRALSAYIARSRATESTFAAYLDVARIAMERRTLDRLLRHRTARFPPRTSDARSAPSLFDTTFNGERSPAETHHVSSSAARRASSCPARGLRHAARDRIPAPRGPSTRDLRAIASTRRERSHSGHDKAPDVNVRFRRP